MTTFSLPSVASGRMVSILDDGRDYPFPANPSSSLQPPTVARRTSDGSADSTPIESPSSGGEASANSESVEGARTDSTASSGQESGSKSRTGSGSNSRADSLFARSGTYSTAPSSQPPSPPLDDLHRNKQALHPTLHPSSAAHDRNYPQRVDDMYLPPSHHSQYPPPFAHASTHGSVSRTQPHLRHEHPYHDGSRDFSPDPAARRIADQNWVAEQDQKQLRREQMRWPLDATSLERERERRARDDAAGAEKARIAAEERRNAREYSTSRNDADVRSSFQERDTASGAPKSEGKSSTAAKPNGKSAQTSKPARRPAPIRTSSGRKRYPCAHPGCDKTFSTSGHAARHNRIHTGAKPYHCTFPGCRARFSRQDNGLQHYRTHIVQTKARSGSFSEAEAAAALSSDAQGDNNMLGYSDSVEAKRTAQLGMQALEDGTAIAVIRDADPGETDAGTSRQKRSKGKGKASDHPRASAMDESSDHRSNEGDDDDDEDEEEEGGYDENGPGQGNGTHKATDSNDDDDDGENGFELGSPPRGPHTMLHFPSFHQSANDFTFSTQRHSATGAGADPRSLPSRLPDAHVFSTSSSAPRARDQSFRLSTDLTSPKLDAQQAAHRRSNSLTYPIGFQSGRVQDGDAAMARQLPPLGLASSPSLNGDAGSALMALATRRSSTASSQGGNGIAMSPHRRRASFLGGINLGPSSMLPPGATNSSGQPSLPAMASAKPGGPASLTPFSSDRSTSQRVDSLAAVAPPDVHDR